MAGKHFKKNRKFLKFMDIIATISAYVSLTAFLFIIIRILLREFIEFSLSTITKENCYLLIFPLILSIYMVAKYIRVTSPFAKDLKELEESEKSDKNQ